VFVVILVSVLQQLLKFRTAGAEGVDLCD
jgi:hypothetical protein